MMKRLAAALAAIAVLGMTLVIPAAAEDFDPEEAYGEIISYYAHHLETEWKEYVYKDGLISNAKSGDANMDNPEIVGNVWKHISYYDAGYCYYDINGDGIEELLLGNYYDGSGITHRILDVFTFHEGRVIHLYSDYPPYLGGNPCCFTIVGNEIEYRFGMNMHGESFGINRYRIANGTLCPTHSCVYGTGCYTQDAQGGETSWDEVPKVTITLEEFWAEWHGENDTAKAVCPPLHPIDGSNRPVPEAKPVSVPVQGAYGYDALLAAIKTNLELGNFNYEYGAELPGLQGLDSGNIGYLWQFYVSPKTTDANGFVYLDLDGDGQKELGIGAIGEDGRLVLYDLYTIYDGKILHLAESSERDRFSFGVDGTITEYFGSGTYGIEYVYRLEYGAFQIAKQYEFYHDIYARLRDPGTPSANWETIDRETYFAEVNAFRAPAPMATTFAAFAPTDCTPGDLDTNGTVNAADGAAILIAAARLGAGETSGLTASQESAADLDGDGSINASDAAAVLQYAAFVGAGGTAPIGEFLQNAIQT